MENILKEAIESYFGRLGEDLGSVSAKDRLNAVIKLSEFVIPKLSREKVIKEIDKTVEVSFEFVK